MQQAPTAYRTQINDLLLTALAMGDLPVHASSLIQLEGHGREDFVDDIDLTRTLGWFNTSPFPVRLDPGRDPDLDQADQGATACYPQQGPGLWRAALPGR